MADEKVREHYALQVVVLAELLSETRTEFDTELSYLGIDLSSWEKEAAEAPWSAAVTLGLAKELREHLALYRPIRPQADFQGSGG